MIATDANHRASTKSIVHSGASVMNYSFPPDVGQRVQSQLELGLYQSEDEVLRAAMSALEREHGDLAAIAAGIEDMEAGRHRPFTDINAEFRQKHNIPDKV
jgi:Arc/MetJ-type ribon-helix-helix transcriptional regulator